MFHQCPSIDNAVCLYLQLLMTKLKGNTLPIGSMANNDKKIIQMIECWIEQTSPACGYQDPKVV